MKLYFMIGLPTETDEDVRGVVETGDRAPSQVGKRRGEGPRRRGDGQRLDARAEAPHALPVGRDGYARARSRSKQQMLRDEARGHRAVEAPHARGQRLACSRASSRAATARSPTCSSARGGTARASTRGTTSSSSTSGRRRSPHCGVDRAQLPRHDPASPRACPGATSTSGLEDGFLAREYRKALQNRLSPPCGKVAGDVRAPRQPRGRARRRAPPRLLRLRRRLRSDADARGADRLPDEARRREAAPARHPRSRRRLRARPGRCRRAALRAAPSPHATPRPQGRAGFRYRFRYEKTGATALLGHLDVIRELPARPPPGGRVDGLHERLPPQAGHELRPGALARRARASTSTPTSASSTDLDPRGARRARGCA